MVVSIKQKPKVRISYDEMEAYLFLPTPTGKDTYVLKDILELLKFNGVKFGVDEAKVSVMIRERLYDREYRNGKMVYCLEGNYSEYYLEDETEEPEYLIPENVLGHNENDKQTERFLPQMHVENKTAGKLYLHEKCDDFWGYEIIANVTYVGQQPSYWF